MSFAHFVPAAPVVTPQRAAELYYKGIPKSQLKSISRRIAQRFTSIANQSPPAIQQRIQEQGADCNTTTGL
ncbi:MAG TPA: hypothetical protein PK306_05075 [Aquabacterium sp.]|nr:hypothetical protein [Aquabacterium sp.]